MWGTAHLTLLLQEKISRTFTAVEAYGWTLFSKESRRSVHLAVSTVFFSWHPFLTSPITGPAWPEVNLENLLHTPPENGPWAEISQRVRSKTKKFNRSTSHQSAGRHDLRNEVLMGMRPRFGNENQEERVPRIGHYARHRILLRMKESGFTYKEALGGKPNSKSTPKPSQPHRTTPNLGKDIKTRCYFSLLFAGPMIGAGRCVPTAMPSFCFAWNPGKSNQSQKRWPAWPAAGRGLKWGFRLPGQHKGHASIKASRPLRTQHTDQKTRASLGGESKVFRRA